jgi:hypothetical protein
MNTVTLLVGVIVAGSPGNSSTNTTTKAYQDIKSCVAALQKASEDDANKPDVISVNASCAVLNGSNALKSLIGGRK